MKAIRVKSIPHLMRLVKQRKCVTFAPLRRHQPAAFVVCMQAWRVQGFIDRGMFVYKPMKPFHPCQTGDSSNNEYAGRLLAGRENLTMPTPHKPGVKA